jgi:mycothiol synthase
MGQYTLPPGFSARRPILDDIGALLAMNEIVDLAEFGKIRVTETELRSIWGFPGHDPEEDMWLVLSAEDQLVAFAFVVHFMPLSKIFLDLRVHPDYTGLGLADYLLELSQERVRALLSDAQDGVRVSLSVGFPQKSGEVRQTAEKAGMQHVRSNWLMQIEMDQLPPEPVWPAGLEIRPYTSELLDAVYEADQEVFRDHWGHVRQEFEVWQYWTVKREGFDPQLWFLAFAGEEIAAYALCSYEHGDAWVGELGVKRAWRQQGLGLALLHHAFGEFYRRGDRKVTLNVDSQSLTGATRLYTRAGMHQIFQMESYELEVRPGVELSTEQLSN